MREKLETLSLVQLRELAKAQGLRVTGRRKSELVDLLCEAAEQQPENKPREAQEALPASESAPEHRRAGARSRSMGERPQRRTRPQAPAHSAANRAEGEAMAAESETVAAAAPVEMLQVSAPGMAQPADAGEAQSADAQAVELHRSSEIAQGEEDRQQTREESESRQQPEEPQRHTARLRHAVAEQVAGEAQPYAEQALQQHGAEEQQETPEAPAAEQSEAGLAGEHTPWRRSQYQSQAAPQAEGFSPEGQTLRTTRSYSSQRRMQGTGLQNGSRSQGVMRRQSYQSAEGERQPMQRRSYSSGMNNQEGRKPMQRRLSYQPLEGKAMQRPQPRPVDYRAEETTPAYEEEGAENGMSQDMRSSRPVVSLSIGEQSPEITALDSGKEANGILEVMAEGYGFIRCENFLPGENDVYVAPSQIRRFNLKTGDIVRGNRRIKTATERFAALLYITSVNGYPVAEAEKRPAFENLTPIFPNERIRLESGDKAPLPLRVMDLLAPIGKGQRGMIVSPPKAGKTTLLKQVAKSVIRDKDMHLIILLIDERPEEVTDIREEVVGENVEVIYSTFDELPERHKRVSEMVIERAKRLVEYGKDVTILLDSITRLARAYNLVVPPSGRTLSGGLDPAALHMPKRFFGAARNMREGGSLTILATALIETGSRMDDVIYEEFKGTGNMELVLDRKLSEKRIFPAIDILKSGTRRDDLLLSKEELEAVANIRKGFSTLKPEDAVEKVLDLFAHTRNNRDFVAMAGKLKFY